MLLFTLSTSRLIESITVRIHLIPADFYLTNILSHFWAFLVAFILNFIFMVIKRYFGERIDFDLMI